MAMSRSATSVNMPPQNWCAVDGKQAFLQVFGITAADFGAQVHMMIY